ncbi:hypothetical protein COCC4DRAFT_137081 [Bipolaris maydis ATCC 48331]|uniref:Uncharacterized protein n=2 Tax=Cochliobolus heterostrophus TaxID=5016 RepID=M2U4N5_COCH5|nr:uncharacterized protein COCC4DRAFT_137081 [Bipolaris maydis ATCC 48331]EMD88701.1 hypothetical protein COCHEDRAFT_1158651 [Bipolaris maydis C5]ENI05582.1 hypothetical protein COCC4DRAFT_137081 [Bipolaris maydis ATCC 48331]
MSKSLRSKLCLGLVAVKTWNGLFADLEIFRVSASLGCLDTWEPGSLSVTMKPPREQGPRISRSDRAPKVSSEAFQHPLVLGFPCNCSSYAHYTHKCSHDSFILPTMRQAVRVFFRFVSQLAPTPLAFVISAPDERAISGLVQSPSYPLPVRMRHVGRWLCTIIRA